MKRIEPNLLLALATAVPLALLVATASLFGEPGNTLKYVLMAVLCSILFVVLNGILAKHSGQSLETIKNDTERDNFMTAQMAKDYGLIDHILTRNELAKMTQK